jgi:hypothetical protein
VARFAGGARVGPRKPGAADRPAAPTGPATQVVYSFALSVLFFNDRITPATAGGVLCTLCGVVLVVLRHGPPPPPRPRPALAAKASDACAPCEAPAEPSAECEAAAGRDAAAASDTAAEGRSGPSRTPSMVPQRSLRALESIRRFSAELAAPAAAPVSAARSLLRNVSRVAAAHMEQQPSLSAAELAVAAEGACGASTALLAMSATAFDTFGGAPPRDAEASGGQGLPPAAGSAADAVAAAFGGDGPEGGAGGGLIPAARGDVEALLAKSPSGDDAGAAETTARVLGEPGTTHCAALTGLEPPASPRMSSRLSVGHDDAGHDGAPGGC